MPRRPSNNPRAWVLTVFLTVIVVDAVAEIGSPFFFEVVGLLIGTVVVMHRLFPGSWMFTLSLINLLAVYSCVFAFLVESNFKPVSPFMLLIGYSLPILGFLGACFRDKDAIRALVAPGDLKLDLRPGKAFNWLLVVLGIGVMTFAAPGLGLKQGAYNNLFLISMVVIGAIVFLVGRHVAVFLVDVGLLFEEFSRRIVHLVRPVFAFLTFYSLLVIVFAGFYRIIDQWGTAGHFLVQGAVRKLSFAEALYFSVVTINTVGYGDVIPVSPVARVVATAEIVCGLLLLLFGFSEIIAYSRTRLQKDRDENRPPSAT